MMTAQQKQQILQQGMSLEKVEEQIENFENDFPFLKIKAPAAVGDGIKKLSDEELKHFVSTYEQQMAEKEIVKFVPASGAASRMFKDLYAYLESDNNDISKNDFIQNFFVNLSSFAFYEDIDQSMKKDGTSVQQALEEKKHKLILEYLLEGKGLGYGDLPKGLLKFHIYEKENRTPVHEHFVEGAQYGVGKDNTARLHFTVSPEHQVRFEEHVKEIRPSMEEKYGTKFETSFSQQKKSTDTIAVNMDNTPFLEENGEILFRPAGHGALLENLNEIDADVVFIKNIDNVVPDRLKDPTNTYKKAIGGVLFSVQEKIFDALHQLEAKVDVNSIAAAEKVFEQELGSKFPDNYASYSPEEERDFLRQKLNRPTRVCGMVENTGEPGGGPFWILEEGGNTSLQIAETAQLNLEDEGQAQLLKASSHFNPTDLICGLKDYRGNQFDLLKYRDPKTGFNTQKSKNGKALKAQELPGLWNGSMSDWNSIFVEVPLITFNPVKTINDLLREEHR
jgi:hypothetical protein